MLNVSDDFVLSSYKAMQMAILNMTLKECSDAGAIVGDVIPDDLKPFLNIHACNDIAGIAFCAGIVYGIRLERMKNKARQTQGEKKGDYINGNREC